MAAATPTRRRTLVDVLRLGPAPGIVDAIELVDGLRTAARPSRPFDPETAAAFAEISRVLRRHPAAKAFPQVAALAYWIRPAEISRLESAFLAMQDSSVLLVPRGVVFHIPPANVDTLFVYSWVLSALVGNANVIRLSADQPKVTSLVLDCIFGVLKQTEALGRTTAFVRYGHEYEITESLSTADVRVIWGGDETVQRVRAVPRPPRSIELAFADRYSFCVLDAPAVRALSRDPLISLAGAFFNDTYWFDQMGCSSPRLVAWRGSAADTAAAADRFYAAVSEQISGHRVETATGASMAKLVHVGSATVDGVVARADWRSPTMTVAHLADVAFVRDAPGGGLFYNVRIEALGDLVHVIDGRDQTMTHHGIDRADLLAFAQALNGRGVDRMVPVGSALTFGRFWDGFDLLRSFTRTVAIDRSAS